MIDGLNMRLTYSLLIDGRAIGDMRIIDSTRRKIDY